MVHHRSIENQTVVFGNQGALWGNAMTWFDHATGSVWSQPLGEAIAGPAIGAKLDLLPSTLTQWGEWKRLHPNTLALDAPGGHSGFGVDQMAIVVAFADDSAAYPVSDVDVVLNDVVDGIPLAIVLDPEGAESWSVFSRTLDGGVVVELSFTPEGTLVDAITRTTFDAARGIGIAGELSDQNLDHLPGFTSFEDDYFTFYPDGRIWSSPG
jgi:hypothetical protein